MYFQKNRIIPVDLGTFFFQPKIQKKPRTMIITAQMIAWPKADSFCIRIIFHKFRQTNSCFHKISCERTSKSVQQLFPIQLLDSSGIRRGGCSVHCLGLLSDHSHYSVLYHGQDNVQAYLCRPTKKQHHYMTQTAKNDGRFTYIQHSRIN